MLSLGIIPLLPTPGEGTFPTFVSVSLIDLTALIILVVILIVLGVKYLPKPSPSTTRLLGRGVRELGAAGMLRVFANELVNRVILQRDLINKERIRRFAHLCMFWGFVGLAVTTTADYIFNEPGNYIPLFGGTLSWIRLLGNVSGVVMMLGASITLGRMAGVRTFRERVSFSDAWFSILLFLVGLTGFVAEYFGDIAHSINPDIPPAAQYSFLTTASPLIMIPYGVHLVLITLLFLSAPVSAFIHALRVPSLRYMDSIGASISAKQEQQQTNSPIVDQAAGQDVAETRERPFVQNTLRKIKEEVMIEQVKRSYYQKQDDGVEDEAPEEK